MSYLKEQLCPPLLKRHLKGLFGTVRWHGDYPNWKSAAAACSGYDAPQIAQNVLEKTLAVIRGEAAFERDGVAFSGIEFNWPALACILSAAEAASGRLDVLDFGGSLGSFFHQHRQFLSGEKQWHVVEQAHYVELGKSHLHEKGLHFHFTIQECLQVASPTLAYVSSVLPYLPDPWSILDEMTAGPFTHLLVDRTQFTDNTADRLTVQRVSGSICASSYPCRFFSRAAFLNRLSAQWEIMAEWDDLVDPCNLSGCRFLGMFFKRRAA